MPLIDIAAISQPCSCFGNNLGVASRPKTSFYNNNYFISNNDRLGLGLASSFSWKTLFPAHKKLSKHYNNLARRELLRVGREIFTVRSMVATIEKNPTSSDVSHLINSVTSNNDTEEDWTEQVDDREKLRRMRISKANKGNTPWNKGRKHSEETLRKIKERTRIAMQNPKVKRKLVKLGHAQSDETRVKIGVGVRLGWEKRREKLMLQETCLYDWQNLIANAARTGVCGENELQWDSYKVLDEQLEKEWLESVEQRKHAPRPRGNKRAPKSAEQRRKISAAIAAKWADPGYRVKVCSALAKFHGVSETTVRKPRKKPIGEGQTRRSSKLKGEAENKNDTKSPLKKIKLKRSKAPLYKDPLASSKLEMLKTIRAQRVATINKKTEAITRAKLLIAEAEKAVEALEIAAQSSSIAQMSLMESRMLITEATQFLDSIMKDDAVTLESDDVPADVKIIPEADDCKGDIDMAIVNHTKVNGVHCLSIDDKNEQDLSFNKFVLSNLMEDDAPDEEPQERNLNIVDELEHHLSGSSLSPELDNSTYDESKFEMGFTDPELNDNEIVHLQPPLENGLKVNGVASSPRKPNVIKKWVRGRLVEVEDT